MKKKFTSSHVHFKFFVALLFFTCQFTRINAQGNALNLDGIDDHVIVGPAGGLYAPGSAYTKEAWVLSLGGGVDAENILSSSDPFFLEFDNHYQASNAYIINVQEPHDVIDPELRAFNRWTHMAVTYDGATTMKLYRNGALVATNTAVSFSSLSGQNYIGTFIDQFSNPNYFLKGIIDEVRVYNVALTQANIQADMVSTVSSVPGNLVAYYNFNTGTAGGTNTGLTTLTDLSGHGNNGTLTNFALTGGTSNWVGSYAMIFSSTTAANSITNVSFNANWTTPVAGVGLVDQYYVEVGTDADFTGVIPGSPFVVPFGTNTLSVAGLAPNTTYYYRVWPDKGFSNVGAISNVTAVTTLTTLPVNSLSFNVSKSTSANLLQWSTGAEQNTRYFEVQQSTSGKDFKTIAVVNASGNSNSVKNYQYSDNLSLVQPPVTYYRLKLVDINSSFTYSDILLIKNTKGVTVTVYPNPAQDKIIVNVTDKSLMNTTARLSDISGKLLQNVPITQTVTTININQYQKGVYLLRLANGESLKLVKE